jgi:putative endonuclease
VGRGVTSAVGHRAEQTALRFLLDRGLKPVTRNFRSRGGEIDLIMMHRDCLVFVEVRYRASTRFSSPGSTVDMRKQRKILRTAALFIARETQFANHTMRFDVVAIAGNTSHTIRWIRDAFRPGQSSL